MFFKYLLSYLLILFVPLFIINGIYGRRVNAVYQEEIMSNIQTDLDILGSAVDDEIISMSNTVTQLAVWWILTDLTLSAIRFRQGK
ncbi:MAG: hypothetical protein RSC96_02190 [Oscillospiraceae bacterium]